MYKVREFSTSDNSSYLLVRETTSLPRPPAGYYRAGQGNQGFFLTKIVVDPVPIRATKDLQNVLGIVGTFWAAAPKYAGLGFPHKRGILFYGIPGTGKTTMVRAVAESVIAADGIVIIVGAGDGSMAHSVL